MENIFTAIDRFINGPEIAIFHTFQKPPYGGGNQFLMALTKELKRQGFDVGANKIGKNTKAVMFNSFEFDRNKLENGWRKHKPKMVQRLAGPIGIYRGTDIEIDREIWAWNGKFADSTIFISNYSYNKYRELGLEYKDPHTILNASDPDIFNKNGLIAAPPGERRIRLIATAWSNNPKKGGPILSWLDLHLDHTKYELTFVGRTKAEFKGATLIDPVPSEELAKILKQHDIYIAPSEDDPCSNALVEALTCGLPAAFRNSGGHPELVKAGGEGWTDGPSLLTAIEKIAEDIPGYRAKIEANNIRDIAQEYIQVLLPHHAHHQ